MDEPAQTDRPRPRRCEIRVRGRLSETLLAAFPELQGTARGGDTVLAGALPDQAAVFGPLRALLSFRAAFEFARIV